MATDRSEPEAGLRLGIFGGTFNPLHYGHLRSAEEVCEALELSRLWFIPTGNPPHKPGRETTPFADRLTMARLGVEDHPVISVSDLEGRRPGHSYSIETVRQIRREMGPGWEIYFIVGMDAMLEIPTWREYRELFSLCNFAVLKRPGYDAGRLQEVLTREVDTRLRPLHGEVGFAHPSGERVLLQDTTLLNISGTAIRRLVRQGRSIRYLLPEAVRSYIMEHGLYR